MNFISIKPDKVGKLDMHIGFLRFYRDKFLPGFTGAEKKVDIKNRTMNRCSEKPFNEMFKLFDHFFRPAFITHYEKRADFSARKSA